tara:strand:+ start:19501 stop:20457 length:957 start_codon:yes stop_codon:yes gene_type:complete
LNILLSFIVIVSSFIFSFEKISFVSANPFSFQDIITDLDNQQEQEVYGILRLPDNFDKSQKIPLIIGVAGSLDWGEHHHKYLKMYRDMGIATFELNSFKSRGIKSTVGSQTDVTTAMMILDVYKAFEKLSNHPNIDYTKVGITGWSLGGGVTLFSGWKPLKKAINIDLKFAARLAFYPPCFAIPNNIDFENVPTHVLIGELDTWTPADACIEFEKVMKSSGYDFNVTVYDSSYHSFDRESDLHFVENAYSFSDCRFKIRDDGAVLMNFLDIPMSTPLRQKIGLSFCVDRGTTIGENTLARKASFLFSEEFMKKNLLYK